MTCRNVSQLLSATETPKYLPNITTSCYSSLMNTFGNFATDSKGLKLRTEVHWIKYLNTSQSLTLAQFIQSKSLDAPLQIVSRRKTIFRHCTSPLKARMERQQRNVLFMTCVIANVVSGTMRPDEQNVIESAKVECECCLDEELRRLEELKDKLSDLYHVINSTGQ